MQGFTEDAEKAAWRIEEKNGDLVLSDRKRVHLSLPMASANMRFIGDTLLELAQASTAPSDNWEDRALIELSEMAQPIFFGTVIDIEAKNYLSKLSATISLKSGLDGFFQLRRFKEFNLGVLLVGIVFGMAALSFWAARREPGAGHGFVGVAMASLPLLAIGLVSSLGVPTVASHALRNVGQWIIGTSLGLYFTPAVLGLVRASEGNEEPEDGRFWQAGDDAATRCPISATELPVGTSKLMSSSTTKRS